MERVWYPPPGCAAMPQRAVKRCSRCGRVKPLTAFTPAKHCRDGYRGQCRACRAAYMRQWRRRNLVYARAKARRQNRRRREWLIAYRRNPDRQFKQAVRNLTYWAVQVGLLPRKDRCERCGAGGKGVRLNRHHPDYSDPLRIVWLCTSCHADVHRKYGESD